MFLVLHTFFLSAHGPREGKEKQTPKGMLDQSGVPPAALIPTYAKGSCLSVTSLLSAAFHSIYSQFVQYYYNPNFPSNVNNLFFSAAQGHGSGVFQQRRELYCSGAVVCGRIHPRWICDKSGKAPLNGLHESNRNCLNSKSTSDT